MQGRVRSARKTDRYERRALTLYFVSAFTRLLRLHEAARPGNTHAQRAWGGGGGEQLPFLNYIQPLPRTHVIIVNGMMYVIRKTTRTEHPGNIPAAWSGRDRRGWEVLDTQGTDTLRDESRGTAREAALLITHGGRKIHHPQGQGVQSWGLRIPYPRTHPSGRRPYPPRLKANPLFERTPEAPKQADSSSSSSSRWSRQEFIKNSHQHVRTRSAPTPSPLPSLAPVDVAAAADAAPPSHLLLHEHGSHRPAAAAVRHGGSHPRLLLLAASERGRQRVHARTDPAPSPRVHLLPLRGLRGGV